MYLKLEDGTEITLHFQHIINGGMTFVNGHTGPCQEKPCIVDITQSITGVAFLHPDDQYNKATGRKVALAGAIGRLPREQRTLIWKAYGKYTGAF